MSMDQLMALVPIEAAHSVIDKGRKSRWEKTKERKGGSRWGLPEDKPYLPSHYVDLPPGLTPAQMDQFLREQRYDELSRKLAMAEIELDDPDIRPPSPPPTYDKNGSRTNTRDVRAKNAMTAEHQRLVEYMIKHVEGFAPPSDFKPLKKIRRIEIPLDKYPDYNFMGLIIGPRGCNHKRLESESGAQISVRGKGTQKEGKKTDHQTDEEASLPMHVHVAAESEEAVEKAVALIEPLLDPCHPMHEEFKKRGLEQLSLVNGVPIGQLEQHRCSVCGALGHLAHECPDTQIQNFKKTEVRCALCGDMGHVTMDCKLAKGQANSNIFGTRPAASLPGTHSNPYELMIIDSEYKRMMNELTGETPKTSTTENIPLPVNHPNSPPIGLPSPFGTSHGMAGTPPPGISPVISPPMYISYQYGVGLQTFPAMSNDPRHGLTDPTKSQGPRPKNNMPNTRLGIGHPERTQNLRTDTDNVKVMNQPHPPGNSSESMLQNVMLTNQMNATNNSHTALPMPNHYPIPMSGQFAQQMPVQYHGQVPAQMFVPVSQFPGTMSGPLSNPMNPQLAGLQSWQSINPSIPSHYLIQQSHSQLGFTKDQTQERFDPPLPTDAPPLPPGDMPPMTTNQHSANYMTGPLYNKPDHNSVAMNNPAMMNNYHYINTNLNQASGTSYYDMNISNSPTNDAMDLST